MEIPTASRHTEEENTRATQSAQWTTRWETPAPRYCLPVPSSTSTTTTRGSAGRGTRSLSLPMESQRRKYLNPKLTTVMLLQILQEQEAQGDLCRGHLGGFQLQCQETVFRSFMQGDLYRSHFHWYNNRSVELLLLYFSSFLLSLYHIIYYGFFGCRI